MHELLREPFFSQEILQKGWKGAFDREWQAEALF